MTPGELTTWFHDRGYEFRVVFDSDSNAGSERLHVMARSTSNEVSLYAKQGSDPDLFIARMVAAIACLEGEGSR